MKQRLVNFGLSSRQLEILRLLVQGKSQIQIAHKLGVSRRAVQKQLTNAATLTSTYNTVQLAWWAGKHGIE
jgi:DNA-binding NarL/FixJ family response regulator